MANANIVLYFNNSMICGHQVHKDYPKIKCILDSGHGGMHGYDIKGNIHYIGGCCPDKAVKAI